MKRTTRLKTEKLVTYKNPVLNFTIAKPISKKNNFGISRKTCMWTIYTIYKNDVFVDYMYIYARYRNAFLYYRLTYLYFTQISSKITWTITFI